MNTVENDKDTNNITDTNLTGVSNTSDSGHVEKNLQSDAMQHDTDSSHSDMDKTDKIDNNDKIIDEAGKEFNLTEMIQNLSSVFVGFGWDAPDITGENYEFDIDASAFFLNSGGQVRYDSDFVFYNNLSTENGVIRHGGDNKNKLEEDNEKNNDASFSSQELEGIEDFINNISDQEHIIIRLPEVPFDVLTILFSVTIHEAEEREQHLGLARDMYIRLVDLGTKQEILRYNLPIDTEKKHDAIICAEIIRDGTDWKFLTIGEFKEGGLYKVAHGYGVYVAPT